MDWSSRFYKLAASAVTLIFQTSTYCIISKPLFCYNIEYIHFVGYEDLRLHLKLHQICIFLNNLLVYTLGSLVGKKCYFGDLYINSLQIFGWTSIRHKQFLYNFLNPLAYFFIWIFIFWHVFGNKIHSRLVNNSFVILKYTSKKFYEYILLILIFRLG